MAAIRFTGPGMALFLKRVGQSMPSDLITSSPCMVATRFHAAHLYVFQNFQDKTTNSKGRLCGRGLFSNKKPQASESAHGLDSIG
jgi:hypothetical protein